MKYFTFKREKHGFDDILTDPNIKKLIRMKFMWHRHLIIALQDDEDQGVFSYITIKYGENLIDRASEIDRTPKPYIDYVPKKDVRKMKRSTW